MKILKYLFLLVLLSFVALSVFIATQKGDFSVERSKIINSPKATVYNYINDVKNFEDFESWSLEDSSIRMVFSKKTTGSGASYSWEGVGGKGYAITLKAINGQSIHQKMNYKGAQADVNWFFKDTLNGKTKVTWKAKGTMSFLFKIHTTLNGGSDNIIGTMYEKSLTNIGRNLDYETKTFTIKVNGIVKKTETFYICETFTSEIEKVIKNSQIVIPKLIDFCKTANLIQSGKPFIIYHTYDSEKGLAKISICLPINKEISISGGTSILSHKLNSFEAVKSTLKGDYSHIPDAIVKTKKFINTEKIVTEPSWSHLEILTINKMDVKSPLKLMTEIYFPIKRKVIAVAKVPVYVPQKEGTETQPTEKTPATIPEEEQFEF